MPNQHPQLLIMGRPNVGKSTIINRLLGKRQAITSDESGVTRDIAMYPLTWDSHALLLVDSGGVFLSNSSDIYLQSAIESRVKHAIEQASAILFVVDYQAGIQTHDQLIARYLHQANRPVYVLVNKVDDTRVHHEYTEFYRLGFDTVYPVSGAHGTGFSDLLDAVCTQVYAEADGVEAVESDASHSIAFIGRPNVGKSSLLNTILNDERVLVDNKAGTTRDSVRVPFQFQDQSFILVDTAGIRRKSKITDDVEYYSVVRSSSAMSDVNVVVLVLESDPFLTDHDKRLLSMAMDSAKAIIVFVNKWDLLERSDANRRSLIKKATWAMPALQHYPFIFGSAHLGHQHHSIFAKIPDLVARSQQRIQTSRLNQFIRSVVDHSQPPSKTGQPLRIFYATQAESSPPTFIFFVNNKQLLSPQYQRFLEKRFREAFDFEGVPIRLFFKNRAKVNIRE
ncbi:ribosome biogenesis GTPase Der [Candidatus Marinamargulisbacteria bacterium]|nr:ribosome biogenesis GTPase Der [Candidatus Marinamargulisbacteria bacterium]